MVATSFLMEGIELAAALISMESRAIFNNSFLFSWRFVRIQKVVLLEEQKKCFCMFLQVTVTQQTDN